MDSLDFAETVSSFDPEFSLVDGLIVLSEEELSLLFELGRSTMSEPEDFLA